MDHSTKRLRIELFLWNMRFIRKFPLRSSSVTSTSVKLQFASLIFIEIQLRIANELDSISAVHTWMAESVDRFFFIIFSDSLLWVISCWLIFHTSLLAFILSWLLIIVVVWCCTDYNPIYFFFFVSLEYLLNCKYPWHTSLKLPGK